MRTLVSLVLALGLAAPALAGEKLAVGSLQVTGEDLQEAVRTQVRSAVVGGLVAAHFDLVPDADVQKALAETPGLAGCDTSPCLERLGQIVGARWVFAGTVEVVGSTYAAKARLVPVNGGQEVNVSQVCTACTSREGLDSMSLVGSMLRDKLPSSKPVAAPVPPPQPPQPAKPEVSRATWALRGAGIAAGALGLAGLITGIVEAARNNAPTCGMLDPGVTCAQFRDTTGGIIFGFVTGGVLLAGGAVLSYFGWRHPKHQLALVPSAGPGGAALLLDGRF